MASGNADNMSDDEVGFVYMLYVWGVSKTRIFSCEFIPSTGSTALLSY